jgi:hypothetical protein
MGNIHGRSSKDLFVTTAAKILWKSVHDHRSNDEFLLEEYFRTNSKAQLCDHAAVMPIAIILTTTKHSNPFSQIISPNGQDHLNELSRRGSVPPSMSACLEAEVGARPNLAALAFRSSWRASSHLQRRGGESNQ